jgi:hypothetical protein
MRKLKRSSPLMMLTLAEAMRKTARKYNDRHQLKMADELERLAWKEMQLKLPLPEPPAKPLSQDETEHVPLTPGTAPKSAQPHAANTGIHPGIKLALIIFFGFWALSFLPCINNAELGQCYARFPKMILSLFAILTVIIAFIASWIIALRLIFIAGKGHEFDDSFLFYFKGHLAMTAGAFIGSALTFGTWVFWRWIGVL